LAAGKQGISKRFLSYFHSLDKSVGERALGPDQTISAKVQSTIDTATTQARAMDEQRGFSKIAHDYYIRAYSSPFGQKVKKFYTDTSKQVLDIHEEARRIANQEKTPTQTTASGSTADAAAPVVDKSKGV
jgi:TRAP-type mannitol/chloroaromatic compound transport system substrate-binding protein